MKTFYKYMPYSSLLKFLSDPCLRVTPSTCQNDPFEFGYSSSDIDILNCKSSSNELGIALEEFANLHGIISLTTSNSNILMWSYYADSHKGAVVEIYIDDEAPQKLFVNSTGPNKPPFKFQDFIFDKVTYEKNRRFDQIESETDLEKVKHHYYFTKAKQWELEEEYRFITPMSWINKIIFNEAGCKKAHKILQNYSSSITCLNPNSSGDKFYELNPVSLTMIGMENPELISKMWRQSHTNETMFFIRLNSGLPGGMGSQVGRIFLGCQSDHIDFISQLKNDSDEPLSIMGNYTHLLTGDLRNISKAEIDKDEYKISFKPLSGNIYS